MKKMFCGYYKYEESTFDEIWENCYFIFDTNVLLDLYRYSKEACKNIIKLLKGIKSNRLWLPNQVAFEYHKNRVNIIEEQIKIYNNFEESEKKIIESIRSKFIEELNKFKNNPKMEKRHNFISNPNQIISDLKDKFDFIEESVNSLYEYNEFIELRRYKIYYDKLLNKDFILTEITNIFENNVGTKYSNEQISSIISEGIIRYENKIPPGYMDSSNKEDNSKYGDLIIWKQIIDKAKSEKRPILFITNETKDDWWLKKGKKIIGPRPELINEISNDANIIFYMYSLDEFIKYLKQYKIVSIKPDEIEQVDLTIKEVEFIKNLDEESNQEYLAALIGRVFGSRKARLNPKYIPRQIYKDVKELIKTLPNLEIEIIFKKYGFSNTDSLNDEEICDLLDLNIKDFNLLETMAFRRLRHPRRLRILKDYLLEN